MSSESVSARARGAARVAGFATSIFTEMSALARQHGAVNLSQGFPDFESPTWVREAAKGAIDADINQYAISFGSAPLRRAVAAKQAAFYGISYDPDSEVTITSGATEALFCAFMGVVDPGDEVIVFEPCYDSYVPGVEMAGGTARYIRLEAPDWHFDPAALEAAITPRTRAIVVNTPHNPTGKVWSQAELELVADFCQRHDLIAITDEVYEHLIFDEGAHIPLATLPGMRERTITVSGTSKTFSLTGWKVGYLLASRDLSEAIRRVHQFTVFCSAAPLQEALALAVAEAGERGYYEDFLVGYNARRDFLYGALERANLRPLRPQGTFFIMCDVSHLGYASDIAFSRYLTAEVGVACIPPSVFYHNPPPQQLARFCFAKNDATLQAAAERLERGVAVSS